MYLSPASQEPVTEFNIRSEIETTRAMRSLERSRTHEVTRRREESTEQGGVRCEEEESEGRDDEDGTGASGW